MITWSDNNAAVSIYNIARRRGDRAHGAEGRRARDRRSRLVERDLSLRCRPERASCRRSGASFPAATASTRCACSPTSSRSQRFGIPDGIGRGWHVYFKGGWRGTGPRRARPPDRRPPLRQAQDLPGRPHRRRPVDGLRHRDEDQPSSRVEHVCLGILLAILAAAPAAAALGGGGGSILPSPSADANPARAAGPIRRAADRRAARPPPADPAGRAPGAKGIPLGPASVRPGVGRRDRYGGTHAADEGPPALRLGERLQGRDARGLSPPPPGRGELRRPRAAAGDDHPERQQRGRDHLLLTGRRRHRAHGAKGRRPGDRCPRLVE